jgi:hypothetical protein
VIQKLKIKNQQQNYLVRNKIKRKYSIQENKDIQVMMNNTRREKRDSR